MPTGLHWRSWRRQCLQRKHLCIATGNQWAENTPPGRALLTPTPEWMKAHWLHHCFNLWSHFFPISWFKIFKVLSSSHYSNHTNVHRLVHWHRTRMWFLFVDLVLNGLIKVGYVLAMVYLFGISRCPEHINRFAQVQHENLHGAGESLAALAAGSRGMRCHWSRQIHLAALSVSYSDESRWSLVVTEAFEYYMVDPFTETGVQKSLCFLWKIWKS